MNAISPRAFSSAVGLTVPFALLYLSWTLIVPADAGATAARILACESLYRLGMLAELLCGAMTLFVATALYGLLSGVNKQRAVLVAIVALIPIPISFFGLFNELAALAILRGAQYLALFDLRELQALAMFFLKLHGVSRYAVVAELAELWILIGLALRGAKVLA